MRQEILRGVGRVLMVGFSGQRIPEWLKEDLRQSAVSGVILFSRNFEDVQGAAERVAELRAIAPHVLVGIDQEGGRVQRLRSPFPELPPMSVLGRASDPDVVMRTGALLGEAVRSVGIDLNFAPVLDLQRESRDTLVGDRSLGSDPERVSELGAAFIRGIQSSGVAACAKHFPGHGVTLEDSHHALPRVQVPAMRLVQRELAPFRAAVHAGVASMMSAHVVYESVDPRPATRSPVWLKSYLRHRLGFRGVVVSDDLEMTGFGPSEDIGPQSVEAVKAGCDLLLVCRHVGQVRRVQAALCEAVSSGTLPRARLEEAGRRLQILRTAFPPAAPTWNTGRAARFQAARGRLLEALGAAAEDGRPQPEKPMDPTAASDFDDVDASTDHSA
ncbi:MAG: beta-N-acetylhexosaminidase [Myxococcota bacterium]